MAGSTTGLVVFFIVLLARWTVQVALARMRSVTGPKDLITAALLIAYVVLLSNAILFGTIGLLQLSLVAAAFVIRTAALLALRDRFDYSVGNPPDYVHTSRGIYRIHRNPLLLGYWFELAAFSLCLPWGLISRGLVVVICGLLCAWHAHEDNNQLASAIAGYRRYRDRTSNFALSLVFPERARVVDGGRVRVETFGLYACLGLLVGQLLSMVYGVPARLFVVAIPSAFVGSLVYWKLTTSQKKIRFGFSFLGGLLGASVAGAAVLGWGGLFTPELLAAVAFGVAVGHPFGRIGCIAHGCCTGSPTDSHRPYFVAYRDPFQRINRFKGTQSSFCAPSVILEAIGQFTIALMCSLWVHYSLPIWLIGYGSLRVAIQSLRAESGDLTRVGPCAVLIVLGCVSTAFTTYASHMVWRTPEPSSVAVAIAIALATGTAFGVRLNASPAILSPTNDIGLLSAPSAQ